MSSLQITLKSLRTFPSLSRGTMCYHATVYVHGVRVGAIENRGDGGCSRLYPDEGSDQAASLIREARQFARTQTWTFDGKTQPYELLEDYIDSIAEGDADRRALQSRCRRLMKGRVVLVMDDSLLEVKAAPTGQVFAALRERYGEAITILNELPVEKAMALYVRHATPVAEAGA